MNFVIVLEMDTVYLFISGSSTAYEDKMKAQETDDRKRRKSSDDQDTDTGRMDKLMTYNQLHYFSSHILISFDTINKPNFILS